MSEVERLARGVLLVGFDGISLDGDVARHFERAQFAGYVLFARNAGTLAGVRSLTDCLRCLHGVPPVLAVDQEGGRVARLHEGIETIPPMMALGAASDPILARDAGQQTGFDLRRAGFTVNFAPVIDLAREKCDTAIGTRSFGSDLARTVLLARAFASGLEDQGIIATFKHFPGHGSTAADSHLGLPEVDLDERTFRERDLAAFAAVAESASAIMAAHIVARAFDDRSAATLSQALLVRVLREDFRFQGVCFTDCMQMDAIAQTIGTVPGIVAAIAAGADCALVSHDFEVAVEAADAIVRAVEKGALPYARLAQAFGRIAALRERSAPPLDLDAAHLHRGIGRRIARNAITVIRGIAHADPTASIVLSFESATSEGAAGLHEHHARLDAQAPALATLVAPLAPTDSERDQALAAIALSGRRPILLLRRAHVYPEQARTAADTIARFPDAVVVSTREPYDCALFPQARHLIAAYGDDDASMGGIADVLFGNAVATGTLPVRIA